MKNIFTFVLGVLAILGSVAAFANNTVVYGLYSTGQNVILPGNICIRDSQNIRLQPDLVNSFGQRGFVPYNQFAWRVSGQSGVSFIWDARFNRGASPIQAGTETNSVNLSLPSEYGSWAFVEVYSPSFYSTTQRFYISRGDGFGSEPPTSRCVWADPNIYIEDQGEFPGFPQPCFDVCREKAECTDGCPTGALCNYIPGEVPYWEVIACSRRPR